MRVKKIWHQNSLSIVLFGLFLLTFIGGQIHFGHQEYNSERQSHGLPAIGSLQYLGSAHFLEVTMENWESEFLQMGVYVVLTAFLYQKGSSESKSPGEPEAVDRDPRRFKNKKDAPWPVKRGGIILRLYENSLSLAFLALFLGAFIPHAIGGRANYNEEQLLHGEPGVTLLGYLGSDRFWFESFQNWQSEFLAIGSMVVLSIFLRQRGSPESKPVDSPHWQTGE